MHVCLVSLRSSPKQLAMNFAYEEGAVFVRDERNRIIYIYIYTHVYTYIYMYYSFDLFSRKEKEKNKRKKKKERRREREKNNTIVIHTFLFPLSLFRTAASVPFDAQAIKKTCFYVQVFERRVSAHATPLIYRREKERRERSKKKKFNRERERCNCASEKKNEEKGEGIATMGQRAVFPSEPWGLNTLHV